MTNGDPIATLEHAGLLEDVHEIPAYLVPEHKRGQAQSGLYSCCFCGVGDNGVLNAKTVTSEQEEKAGKGQLRLEMGGKILEFTAFLHSDGTRLAVHSETELCPPGDLLTGAFRFNTHRSPITIKRLDTPGKEGVWQFLRYQTASKISASTITQTVPTAGCVKLKLSLMRQRPVFPIHAEPSILEGEQRRALRYPEAIARFADLLLQHRGPKARTLIYACGQVDYFTIFAMQEVFRLLGVRNLTGNAEHCLNAGAVHNEVLTGQEGPFLTMKQGMEGPNRCYVFNGWNGFVTHPPIFNAILKRDDIDAYLVEVMVTESAKALARKLGPERILLIRPRADPHLALAVAHQILHHHPEAIEPRFIEHFSDQASFEQYRDTARSAFFSPSQVAQRIAPEASYVDRLQKGILGMAASFARPGAVPINIPSVGLSQTSGIVAHCLWGNLLAMLGKYGLHADSSVAGGTLRIPGQINAESEVQGLSRKYFMGRIPMSDAAEAARRMDLPEDAYARVLEDAPRAALDYSDPTPDTEELFVFFGTQFEANMMGRSRWLRKLKDPKTRMVVIDPVPDPFSVEHAELIIPSPPHVASTKVYQNGEWKISLSIPQKQAPAETRSDPTIIYDVMAEICQRLEKDESLASAHPDLARHIRSGYLPGRFGLPKAQEDQEATVILQAPPKVELVGLTIGRDAENSICLAHPGISKQHARLRCINRAENRFHIEDMGSTNGTFKNSERIQRAEFTLADKIQLGATVLDAKLYLPLFAASAASTKPPIASAGLVRVDGEVSRPQLWQRIQNYMRGGSGPLYCALEDQQGQPIQWQELLQKGAVLYGGVGTTRYRLDYDSPGHAPFGDIYRRPRDFIFFLPTEEDLHIPQGIILNSGRSCMSDDREAVRFATSTFNSGKSTPTVGMPNENPLHISLMLAEQLQVKEGDQIQITGRHNGEKLTLPVRVSDRLKGETSYVSFHKSRAQLEQGHYINTVTTHEARCPYCAQTQVKANQVLLARVGVPAPLKRPLEATLALHRIADTLPLPAEAVDTTLLDTTAELPLWQGQATPLYVTEIIAETHDVFTFRFQGNPLCKFVYWPGQFCTLILNINGKKVLRSYTISSTPTRPYILEVTIKRVPGGLVSNWLPDHLKVGNRVDIAGPKGRFALVPGKIPKRILFLTGGSGVTPLMAMSRWLCDISANVDIRFLNSVRSPNDIIFRKELELMTSRYKIFEPVVITSTRHCAEGWMGLSGRLDRRMLEMLAPDLHQREVFLCGPPGFMETAKSLLKELKFDQSRLHTESFGGVRTASKNKTTPPPIMPTLSSKEAPIQKKASPTPILTVTFQRSGKKVSTDGKTPLLDLAEEQDIELDYGCRSGSCGDCKVRLVTGEVDMECEDGLEAEDKEAGYVLSCVCVPRTDCVVAV